MRIALDSGVLIRAHVPGAKQHAISHRVVEACLRDARVDVVLAPSFLHEFVHICTDAQHVDHPPSLDEAVEVARSYLDSQNVKCTVINAEVMQESFELLHRYQLSRARLGDAISVASILHSGVNLLCTWQAQDFSCFEELVVHTPESVVLPT